MRKYILMLAAALGLAASCQKQEMVYFDPEEVVAPVLDSISSVLIDTENIKTGKTTFKWTHAYFGIDTQIYYSIEAYKEGSDTTVLASNLTGTKADISYSAMNEKLLFDLELAPGMPEDVNFILAAKLNKGEKYYSEPLAAKVTVVEAEKTYPGVYVLGEFNGWSHDKAQFLFDFAEEGKSYQGVIGLGSKGADGFKITGEASWDDATGNWGMSAEASAEAESIVLSNGSANNITCYSKSFYHFTFEKESLTLKMSKGFNSISAVLNGTAIPMAFDTKTQKFFADVEVEAGAKLLFRFDDGTELGGAINALKTGGSEITYSAAGNYRIFLNMNKWSAISAVFDKGAYGEGSEEGGSDDPDNTSSWGIVGDFNSWGNDIAMTASEGYYVAKGVEIADGERFKFRKDGKWASDGGDERTSATNPVKADMEYAAVEGYDGILVETAGTYDIYLATALDKFYVMTEGKTPADAEKAPEPEMVTVTVYSDNADLGYLYGWWSNEGGSHFTAAWPGTAAAGNETIEGTTYKKFTFEVDKTLFGSTKVKFILNDGRSEGAVQTDDSDPIALAEKMFITVKGNKVVLADGSEEEPEPTPETVAVTFYCDNAAYSHIYGWWNIESSENWFGSPWPGDENVGKETVEGVEYVKWVVNVDKSLYDAQTTVQLLLSDGTDAVKTGDSDRITLTQTVFLTVKDNKPVLKGEDSDEPVIPGTDTWGIIGDFNDWSSDKVMTLDGGYWVAQDVVLAANDEFKFRKNGKWASEGGDERTSASNPVKADKEYAAVTGYDNVVVEAAGTYDIYLNEALDKFYLMTDGKTPADATKPEPAKIAWSISGTFTNWGQENTPDVEFEEEGNYYVARDVEVEANAEFKFRKDKAWAEVRTIKTTLDINRRYSVENNSDGNANMKIATAGTYDIYLAKDLGSMILMEADSDISTASIIGLWSISGSFTGWSGESKPDIQMYETADWLVAKGIEIEANGQFKFRKNQSWNEVRTYKGAISVNTEYAVEHNAEGDSNIIVPTAGTYDIYINHDANKFYLMEEGKTPGQN